MKEEMTSAAIPGTGQTPAGKPAGFGDPIVNPGAAERWKKINAAGQSGILRRKKPNMVEEGDVANFIPKPPKRKVKVAGGNKDEIEQQSKKLEKYHRARREAEANKWQKHRLSEESFAGAMVFEVSSSIFHNVTLEKRKGKHWRTYLEEDDAYHEIREWANKNKGPIVVKNRNTGEMRYVRYGRK